MVHPEQLEGEVSRATIAQPLLLPEENVLVETIAKLKIRPAGSRRDVLTVWAFANQC